MLKEQSREREGEGDEKQMGNVHFHNGFHQFISFNKIDNQNPTNVGERLLKSDKNALSNFTLARSECVK